MNVIKLKKSVIGCWIVWWYYGSEISTFLWWSNAKLVMKDLRMVKIKIDLHFNAISHHVTNQFTRVHYTVHVTHTPSTFTTIFVILWKNKERKIIKIKWMIFENNNEVKYYIQMSPGIYFSFVRTRTFFPHFFQYQKQ